MAYYNERAIMSELEENWLDPDYGTHSYYDDPYLEDDINDTRKYYEVCDDEYVIEEIWARNLEEALEIAEERGFYGCEVKCGGEIGYVKEI